MIQHMMPHMIHLWSASKTCYWNFVQTLKVEMKCKHILMFPAVLTSANITSSLYYLLVNLKWCFQTNPKAKIRNTLPFIPNNQEAGHWVSSPIVLLLFHSKLYSHHLPIHPILYRKFQTLHLSQQPDRRKRQSHRANQKSYNQQNRTILRGIGNKHSHANVGYSLILPDKLLHSLFSVRNNRCITASLLLQLSGCGFPRLIVRLPCGSPSIRRTFFPVCASPIPKLAQVVVLPTLCEASHKVGYGK